jgi:hypothetical protein
MRLEMLMGKDPDFANFFYGLICTLQPRIEQLNLAIESLGDLDTLLGRLQNEVALSNSVACLPACVGTWARKLAG